MCRLTSSLRTSWTKSEIARSRHSQASTHVRVIWVGLPTNTIAETDCTREPLIVKPTPVPQSRMPRTARKCTGVWFIAALIA
jgi:hypothetical protein